MFNVASLIIGFVALILAVIAFIPLAVIGAGVGMVSRSTSGRNLNLFVVVIGVVRLILGGGFL